MTSIFLAKWTPAPKLHKVATLDPTVLPAGTVLRMATRNGARALGFEGKIGELSPGKWADHHRWWTLTNLI